MKVELSQAQLIVIRDALIELKHVEQHQKDYKVSPHRAARIADTRDTLEQIKRLI